MTAHVLPSCSPVIQSMADSVANNNTMYFSTDLGVLVYKDSTGTVYKLYDLPS